MISMSFESGRKLGLVGSLIEIIAPVLMVTALVVFLFYLFTATISSVSSGQSAAAPGLLSFPALIIPFILIGIAWFAGFVLFILSMRHLSRYYNEPAIFKNALYGFILNIVTAVVSVTVELILIFASITRVSTGNTTPVLAAASPPPTIPPSVSSFFSEFVIGYLVVLAVALVLAIVSGIFYMRAFTRLSEKSRVDNFRTAGLLYLIGAATAVIGVGALIQWVAWIIAAMGYRSLKPNEFLASPLIYSAVQPATYSVMGKKYCPYCGWENNMGDNYCSRCGKQLR